MYLLLVRRSSGHAYAGPGWRDRLPVQPRLGMRTAPLSNFAGAVTRTRTSTPTAPIKHHWRPSRPHSGGEGVAQVGHDVADGDLDGLTGGARGDLDRAVGQAAL